MLDLSEEKRIQYVFKSLHKPSDDRLSTVVSILQNDPDPIVRHEAAYILGEINGEQAVKALIEAIQSDENKFVIHEAMLALGTTGSYNHKDVIEPFLNHDDLDLVQTAEITLQRFENHKNKKSHFRDTDPANLNEEDRIQLSFQLLDDSSEESIDKLLQMLLVESNPIVKHEIIFSLGEVSSERVVQPLLNVFEKDDNIFVVHETLLSLGTLGAQLSRSKLIEFTYDIRPEIAVSAKIAIERLDQ